MAVPLFLLLYFSSSFVTTQYRVERMASVVVRIAQAERVQTLDGNRAAPHDNYPRYRDAKKASLDLHFGSTAFAILPYLVAKREFALLAIYSEPHYNVPVLPVRAPPLRTQFF